MDDRGLYETKLQGMKDIKCNKKKRINSAGLIKNKYININPQITDTPITYSFQRKSFYLLNRLLSSMVIHKMKQPSEY